MLQQAAEKLREVAPLLAENDDEDSAVLAEVDESSNQSDAMAAKAGASSSASAASKTRPSAPRWPCFSTRVRRNLAMTLQELLFSSDDAASDVLGRLLPGFGLAADR